MFKIILALALGIFATAHAQAGTCSGAPMQCNFFSSKYTCGQQRGCSWRSSSDDCRGVATSCSAFTTANSCSGQSGCHWRTQFANVTSALTVDDVEPAEAAKLVEDGQAILLDVREESELKASGKAAPAEWLAKSHVDARSATYKKFLMEHDKALPIIVYCRSGQRSGVVARHFESLGFKTMNMGGFDGWVDAKLPVERVP